MKPFLIIQLRPNDQAADGEFEAFLKFGGLSKDEVHRVRMEQTGIPEINFDNYSGVIIGGGPSCISTPEDQKDESQKKFEADLSRLLDQVVAKDFPFLGACYGIGALSKHQKGIVNKEKFSEDVGGVTIKLTEAGKNDPLTQGLPIEFRAFVGHKEACQNVASGAVLLASSDTCPVQMIRVKTNIYATQFHPELDVEGLIVRINVYKFAGYFPPEDAEPLIEQVKKEEVTVPTMILKRFVDKYRN
ncbi:glutamine amidotransferase [Patescibacteria group bacterium]